jgi:hypothetical protein
MSCSKFSNFFSKFLKVSYVGKEKKPHIWILGSSFFFQGFAIVA